MRAFKFILLAGIILLGNPVFTQDNKTLDFKEIDSGETSNTVKLLLLGVNSNEDIDLIKSKFDNQNKILSFDLYYNNGVASAKIIITKNLSAEELRNLLLSIGFDISYQSLIIYDDNLRKELLIKEKESLKQN